MAAPLQAQTAKRSYRRYDRVAVTLHWLIGAMIIAQLAGGFWASNALQSGDPDMRMTVFEIIQIHKSVGLTILLLSVLRLAWRFASPPPPLPEGMSGLERLGAHFSHVAFYGVMIALPLSGWVMVSASPSFKDVPTIYFGLFEIPHLPLEANLGAATAAAWSDGGKIAHFFLGAGSVALLALHVGAALKHHYVSRDQVLARMATWVHPRGVAPEPYVAKASGGRRALASLLAVAAVALAVFWVLPHQKEGAVVQVAADQPLGGASRADEAAAATELDRGPSSWRVNSAESALSFSGKNAGMPFEGVFERWRADIRFDPEDLEAAAVRVEIETASAVTGTAQYDGALPKEDWFHVAQHPLAVFETREIRAGAAPGEYVAEAALTIKGVTQNVVLPFSLSIDGADAEMTAEIELSRFAFELGMEADASAAWVDERIGVSISVRARRAGGA